MRFPVVVIALLAAARVGAQAPSPITTAAPWQRLPADAIVARVARDGGVRLNHQAVALEVLDSVLVRVYAPRPDRTLYLVVDPRAPDRARRIVYRAAHRAGAGIVLLRRDPPGERTTGR